MARKTVVNAKGKTVKAKVIKTKHVGEMRGKKVKEPKKARQSRAAASQMTSLEEHRHNLSLHDDDGQNKNGVRYDKNGKNITFRGW